MREGWEYKELKDVSIYPDERVLVSKLEPDEYVGVENLLKDRGGVRFGRALPNADVAVAYKEEDILIGNIRPYLKKIWLSDRVGGASGDIVPVRINDSYTDRLEPKYLYRVLSSDIFFDYDNSHTKGAKMPRGDRKSISEYVIPIPPLPEQERIVAELDLLSGIIDKQKAQLRELDNLAQSIFYDMFGDPVKNEKEWKVISFKTAFRLRSGDGLTEKEFISGDYPVFGGNGISGHHNTFNKDGKYIIIGRVGAYCGNVRFVNGRFWLTDNAFEAFFDEGEFDFWFTCYLLNTINLHKYANHAAQPVISNIGLKDISIISPSLYLQQSFSTKIESIESQKSSINKSIAETQKLFDYTMDKYFG